MKDLSLTKDIFIKHCPVVLLDWTVVGLMFYFVFSIDSMETTELAILHAASTAAFTQKNLQSLLVDTLIILSRLWDTSHLLSILLAVFLYSNVALTAVSICPLSILSVDRCLNVEYSSGVKT